MFNKPVFLAATLITALALSTPASANDHAAIRYKTVTVDCINVFYREAGNPAKPAIVLLHGFPTSSHMFRNLMPALSDDFYLIAPDYPGFGYSAMPRVDAFEYTFDNLADVVDKLIEKIGLKQYSLYLMDYGAPVGFRLATAHPERVGALIIQNGNAYEEGLLDFWKPIRAYWAERTPENAAPLREFLRAEATKWQYIHGTRMAESISPDTWTIDQALLDRPGNDAIQLALFYDYGSNPPLYPAWQQFLRDHQPPTLVVWGEHDSIFPAEGAHPYKRDLKDIEFHLLNTGHFALEEDGRFIAERIRAFVGPRVRSMR